jgi:hypothetical protein
MITCLQKELIQSLQIDSHSPESSPAPKKIKKIIKHTIDEEYDDHLGQLIQRSSQCRKNSYPLQRSDYFDLLPMNDCPINHQIPCPLTHEELFKICRLTRAPTYACAPPQPCPHCTRTLRPTLTIAVGYAPQFP